jgi:DNA polymerase III epsilon subunit-like protein
MYPWGIYSLTVLRVTSQTGSSGTDQSSSDLQSINEGIDGVTRLVFLDTETTGLDSDRHEIWEIGAIVRDDDPESDDAEWHWQIRPSLRTADATGLRIGRYYERIEVAATLPGSARLIAAPAGNATAGMWMESREVAAMLAPLLDGATLIGAVPDFDARFLGRFLRRHHQAPTWHYHLVDVETLAAGALHQPPPWRFDDLLAAYGLTYDEADRHTALGDARMARDLYDAVLSGADPDLLPSTNRSGV